VGLIDYIITVGLNQSLKVNISELTSSRGECLNSYLLNSYLLEPTLTSLERRTTSGPPWLTTYIYSILRIPLLFPAARQSQTVSSIDSQVQFKRDHRIKYCQQLTKAYIYWKMFEAITTARKNIANFGRKLIEIGQFLAGFSASPTRENDTMQAVSLNVHHSHDHNHKHVHEGGQDDRVRKLEARCLEMEKMINIMKAREDSLRAERVNGEREKIPEDRSRLEGGRLNLQEERKKVDEDGVFPEVWPTLEEKLKAERMLRFRSDLYAFAVAGISGVGKSSLINVFLGEKLAATGAVETTTKINRYPEPGKEPHRRSNVWYDIPGAGTLEIPGWQYFNQQCLFIFDLIIVVIGDRFTETDIQILKHCKRFKVPSILVRSKADQHISNMMADLQDGHYGVPKPQRVLYQQCRIKFIAQTHASVDNQLRLSGLPPQRVFIVSARGQAFGKAYAELGNIMTVGMNDSALRNEMETFIDEVDLISEIMTTSRYRRCEQIGTDCVSLPTPYYIAHNSHNGAYMPLASPTRHVLTMFEAQCSLRH
jgi:GTP-binding protein EngB required for normal cell division